MGLTIESIAFKKGEMIPRKFTCDGLNTSPPIQWSGVPGSTKSFAIIFDDPDAPAKTWVHWILFNIPGDKTTVEEDIPSDKKLTDGSIHGINDFKTYGYKGPCPPGGTHGYHLKLYALDKVLELEPGITKEQLIDAMDGHILEKAELVGQYQRRK